MDSAPAAPRPRVVHVVRDDHGRHVGGDVVQLRSLVAALERVGVDATASTVDAGPDDVDIVNVYNLQRPVPLLADIEAARRRWPAAKVAVSPVEWPVELVALCRSRQAALATRGLKTAAKQLRWWRRSRQVLAGADLILPNSEIELHRLRRWFRLPPSAAWWVVPNGVDVDAWSWDRRTGRAERAPLLTSAGLDPEAAVVVACVARIEPWKNQLGLIEALDAVPGAVALLIGPFGDDRYGAEVERQARARPGRVALVGAQPPEEVRRYLAATDVHVLPSFRETPGLASLEAAAVGCEVVVTGLGSAVEYLGEVAAVVDPARASSIAEGIRNVVAGPHQPGARARVEQFTWAAAAGRLADAYRAALAGSTTAR